jgi:hypothetical protein
MVALTSLLMPPHPRPVASTPFAWHEVPGAEEEPAQEAEQRTAAETTTRVLGHLHTLVLAKTAKGGWPPGRVVAARWRVLQLLMGEGTERGLRSHAEEIGVTPACLSKIGIQFAQSLGMRASWQRLEARAIYSKRAAAVHAGTWVPSEQWQRRKLREAMAAKV